VSPLRLRCLTKRERRQRIYGQFLSRRGASRRERIHPLPEAASAHFRLLSRRGCSTLCRQVEPGLSKKVTIVQDEDIKLLRRIVAGGGRKYTAGNVDRSKYDRLVDMGWLTPFKTNNSDVEYQATDRGRAAAANGHD
jgi:hypothetical protein